MDAPTRAWLVALEEGTCPLCWFDGSVKPDGADPTPTGPGWWEWLGKVDNSVGL